MGIGLSLKSRKAEGFASVYSVSNLLFSFASLSGNIPANAYKVSTTSSSSFVISPEKVCSVDQYEPPCFYESNLNSIIEMLNEKGKRE